MRVSSFFLACMMMAAVAGIAYAGRSVVGAWLSYQDARTARRELIAFREVFRIPEMMAVERRVTVGPLSAPGAVGAAESQALAAARRDTDTAFGEATAALGEVANADERRRSIAAASAVLAGMREQIDRIVALPQALRPPGSLGETLQPLQNAYLGINRLLSVLQSGDTLQDSGIQDSLDLSRLAYSLRQWAAQRGTALIGAIVSRQVMTPAMMEDLAMSAGHLGEIWDQIRTLQETRRLGPEVGAAIAAVQARYFVDNGKIYDGVMTAGRSDAAYPNLADFRRDHVAGTMSPFLIRDSAVDRALARAGNLTTAALNTLMLSAGLLGLVCAVIAAATWLFHRRVVAPLTALTATISALAERDHTVTVPYRSRRDEVGRMADAIEILRGNDVAFRQLADHAAQEQAANQQRAVRIGQLCEDFNQDTTTTIAAALQSATLMRDGAQTSSSLVAEVEKRTLSVVATTGQAAGEVRAIVASAEHLTGSITALAGHVCNSTEMANQAEAAVRQTASRMQELTAATDRIGTVTSLIQRIAAQTNLLALNATIEAARAGEAGRGFAVVAGEVKALASQTASATDDIGSQIALVQAATGGVDRMIAEIFQSIAEISRVGHHVGEAVEDQKKATAEIGGYVREAARGMEAVAGDIGNVQAAAGRTGLAAGEMTLSVERLTSDAECLTEQISTFIAGVRAA